MSRVEPNRNVYVGHRYVPKIFGEWDKKNEYEGLSIVTHKGNSYTSKKRVPVGIDILNEEFWVITGNYNAQVEYYRQETERVSDELDKKSNLSDFENFKSESLDDFNTFKTDTNQNINTFKSETDESINTFKTETTKDIQDFKTETNTNINSFKSDTDESINTFKTEINDDIETLDNDLSHLSDVSSVKGINVLYPPKGYQPAKGDGTSNDTARLQILIDNFSDIIIPGGYIFRTDTLELREGTSISGNGKLKSVNGHNSNILNITGKTSNVTIRGISLEGVGYSNDYDENTVGRNTGIFVYGGCENLVFKDLKISNFTRDGIYINEDDTNKSLGYPKNIIIDNVLVTNVTRNSISLIANRYTNITNSKLIGYGLCGIDVEGYESTTINRDVTIDNIYAYSNFISTGSAIQCNSQETVFSNKFSNVKILNCYTWTDSIPSVIRSSGFKNTIIDNNIVVNFYSGINSSNGRVTNNTLRDPKMNVPVSTSIAAIYSYSDVAVINNVIDGSSHVGILVDNAPGSYISDNKISNTGFIATTTHFKSGILVQNTDNAYILNNLIIGNKNGSTDYGVHFRNSIDNVIKGNMTTDVSKEAYFFVTDSQKLNEDNHEF